MATRIACRIFLPVLILLAAAFPQMPAQGDFYYKLTPRTAEKGRAVTFEANRFGACLVSYDVTYELLPTPISSKRTMIVNITAKMRPQCATAYGYSGPKAVFENFGIGAYIIQFDSASDFRQNLGDSNRFEIVAPSTAVGQAEKPGVSKTSGLLGRGVSASGGLPVADGRLINGQWRKEE